MDITSFNRVLKFSVKFSLKSCLLLRSGQEGEFTDSSLDKTPDDKYLHINGYVWASLLKRALERVQGAGGIAKDIGKYSALVGVSPLWCESTFVDLPDTDIRYGIRINRKWGATDIGALFQDEILPPGVNLTLNLNYFCHADDLNEIKQYLLYALWVIDQGIETIGGGWSYGYGKLNFVSAQCQDLDLTEKSHRDRLWRFDDFDKTYDSPSKPVIEKPWIKFIVHGCIEKGQLLAIHTDAPSFDAIKEYPELPDSFVFHRFSFNASGKLDSEIVIPGKAIRQALLSMPLERKLLTLGEPECKDFINKQDNGCDDCKRCRWFGCTDRRGIISVEDSLIQGADSVVVQRIQLCEHSMQNMNLFSGEYLSKGKFTFEILVDRSQSESDSNSLIHEIELLIDEMKENAKAPPGWYRLGATSTCTGQFSITDYTKESF